MRSSSCSTARRWALELEGVARRVAQKARVANARRRVHERRLAERTRPGNAFAEADRVALHEEIHHLPEKLRAPLLLCYLEEMSYAAAAARLGVTEGSIRGRLVKARDLLRARLTRRGENARERHVTSAEWKQPERAVPSALIAATTRSLPSGARSSQLRNNGSIRGG